MMTPVALMTRRRLGVVSEVEAFDERRDDVVEGRRSASAGDGGSRLLQLLARHLDDDLRRVGVAEPATRSSLSSRSTLGNRR